MTSPALNLFGLNSFKSSCTQVSNVLFRVYIIIFGPKEISIIVGKHFLWLFPLSNSGSLRQKVCSFCLTLRAKGIIGMRYLNITTDHRWILLKRAGNMDFKVFLLLAWTSVWTNSWVWEALMLMWRQYNVLWRHCDVCRLTIVDGVVGEAESRLLYGAIWFEVHVEVVSSTCHYPSDHRPTPQSQPAGRWSRAWSKNRGPHDEVKTWKAFRITGPMWGESTGNRWIPFRKPVVQSLDLLSLLAWTSNTLLHKQCSCR